MSAPLQITKENAQKAYNAGCSDVKAVLENLLGKETFVPLDIREKVKSWEDACKVVGLNIQKEKDRLSGNSPDEIAYAKLRVIIRALNGDWIPDWRNTNQAKYYPWFDMSSGSGLSFYAVFVRLSFSAVGSRLCFKSRELAEYAAKQFISIYTEYFIIK